MLLPPASMVVLFFFFLLFNSLLGVSSVSCSQIADYFLIIAHCFLLD